MRNNQQEGPIPESQLQQLFIQRALPPDAFVWSNHLAEWTPAGNIAIFRVDAQPASEPIAERQPSDAKIRGRSSFEKARSASLESPEADAPSHPNTEEVQNFAGNLIEQIMWVVTRPKPFFEAMPTTGGLSGPLTFFGACLAVHAIMIGILSMGIIAPLIILILFPMALFLGALLVNFMAQALGGRGTFEGTVRVYCYSYVTLLASWVPIAGIFIGLYSWYLFFLGFTKVHQLDTLKTIGVLAASIFVAVVFSTLAACGIAISAFIISGGGR